MSLSETASKPTLIEKLVDRRKPVAILSFVKAVVLLGVAIWIGVTWTRGLAPIWLWCGGMAVLSLAAGLWLLLYDAPERRGLDEIRTMVLSVGGLAGLLTVALGVVLGYVWWDDILAWMQPGGAVRTGTSKEQWQAGLRALLPMPILLAGLAIMFASLQLARTDERNNPVLRRLFHGYNAVLTCLLLLLVLVVANVFVGVKLQKPLDFTSSNMFSLSDRSINILKHLDKPVKIYVILDSGGPITLAVQAMLTNCREVTDKVQMDQLSPNPNANPIKYDELRRKFPGLEPGLLIEYGPKDKEEYRQIKADELFSQEFDRGSRGPPKFQFKGEDALMTELSFLEEGKQKPTIYFLQGHGELSLEDTNPRSLTGSGSLKQRLEKRNFIVKPLKIDALDPKVPADATMVLIAGPHNMLPDFALKALGEYMGKSGKLVILLGPTPNRQRTEMVQTGLEPFLAKFNVQVGNDRVLSRPSRGILQMTDLAAEGNPQLKNDPLVRPFIDVQIPLVGGTRSVKPVPARPGMPSRLHAESVLTSYPGLPVWEESNLGTNPERLFENYVKNDLKTLQRKLKDSLSVAVSVSEMTGPPPNPHMFTPPEPTAQKPRLVVIGNSTIGSNAFTNSRIGGDGYEFLASSMEWLRERPGNIGIEPKKHQVYTLPTNTSPWPFVLMPTALILFGVVGLGTGVWLVRRR